MAQAQCRRKTPAVMASTVSDLTDISDIQKIYVTLSERDITIEPGGTAQVVVSMTNGQETPDRLSLEVEGVDVEWYAIPVPAVNVAPGAMAQERILFRMARSSENRAGTYPFLVRVQALETGEIGVAQATLTVKPFSSLQVDLAPKRGVATFFRPLEDFDVTVLNLGNSEETLDLYASDPDDGCAYEFDRDRIVLKPGQSEVVPLAARPKTLSVLGGVRLFGFTVTTRSVEQPIFSATTHGQIEKRALISPLLGIFLLLLLFGAAGWVLTRPHPPEPLVIKAFTAVPDHVNSGQDVTLNWDVSPLNSRVIITTRLGPRGAEIMSPGEMRGAVGSVTVKPEFPGAHYTLVVRDPSGRLKDRRMERRVLVNPPPRPPALKIVQFRAEPAKIHTGETVTLSWQATGQTGFILDPGDHRMSQFVQTQTVTPEQDCEYTLRALSPDPKTMPAAKRVKVTVVPKDFTIAEIITFTASPSTPYLGDSVTLRWKTRYAKRVQIDSDGSPVGEVPANAGSVLIPVTQPTKFTLTATDSVGKSVTKVISVLPKPRPPQPEEPGQTSPKPENLPPSSGAITPSTPGRTQ